MSKESPQGLSYRDAGVDIDAGDALIDRIRASVAATKTPGTLGGIGGFGGLFELPAGLEQPVLVAGTDGVGTKLRLALDHNAHDQVGIDLVAMCANDVVVAGARPLFFLDYYATGKLDVAVAERVIKGIAGGCQQAGMALIGGETAEMPGMYSDDDYDLAGFCVGIVDKARIIDGSRIAPGNALLALAASGPHSNGFSLIRRVLDANPEEASRWIAAAMTPTRIYVKPLLALIDRVDVLGLAHITGGGITENVPRMLPPDVEAHIDLGAWARPEFFSWLEASGPIQEPELLRTFNCGIGMVIAVPESDANLAATVLREAGEEVFRIGTTAAGDGGTIYFNSR